MISISLCMIVKNEEQVLARCLDSVAPLMDELIIVDTGSTDRTSILTASMILTGVMTLQRLEITHFPLHPWITFMHRMQMNILTRSTRNVSLY